MHLSYTFLDRALCPGPGFELSLLIINKRLSECGLKPGSDLTLNQNPIIGIGPHRPLPNGAINANLLIGG